MDVLQTEDINQNVLKANATITSVSRIPSELKDIPFTAYVITEDQIRKRGYATLVDVLKDLPGIKVSQPGSALHGETFLMRGMFGNYQVKILVDDLPIQPSASSGMPIGAQLPVAQAERIEVLYGPAAAAYGADAMAGVINIITKKADNLTFIDADGSVGIPGNYRFDATVGGRFAKNNTVWNYMFYGGIDQFNNLPITGGEYEEYYDPSKYVPTGDEHIYLNSDDYQGTINQPKFGQIPQQSQKFGFRLGHKKLSIGMDFGRREIHAAVGSNPLYRAYHDPTTRYGEQLMRVFGAYRVSFNHWTSITNAQFLTYRIDPSSSYITIDNPTTFQGKFFNYGASQDIYLEQFLSRELGKRWTLLAGMTFQFSSNFPQFDFFQSPFNPGDFRFFNNDAPSEFSYLDSLGVGPQNFYNIGALLDASYSSKKWNLLFGLRLDQREFFGFVISPRLGGVYKINRHNRLRMTISTAFRPPSTYLMANGVAYYEDADTAIGIPYSNHKLKAETLSNVDLGWWFKFNDRHQLDISAFFHVVQNHISKTSDEINIDGFVYPYYGFVSDENSQSTLLGLQIQYLSDIQLGTTVLQSNLSAQVSQGSEQLPFDRGTLDYYREQPMFYAKWLIEYEFINHFRVMLRAHAFTEWRTRSVIAEELQDILVAPSGYFLDFQLAYSFNKGMEVYAMVNNLTNNHYYGIDASGGAGIIGSRAVFQDLVFNPQMLRIFKFGVRLSL